MHDREEAERLFRSEAGRMRQVAMMLLADEEEARDAVSDVFARLMEGAIRLPREKPERYLLVCVRNLCFDRIRRLSQKERLKRHLTMHQSSLISAENEFALVTEIIDYASQHLTPQSWRVFQLRFDEGLTASETARQLGISEVSVYKHLAKALRLLRQHFYSQ